MESSLIAFRLPDFESCILGFTGPHPSRTNTQHICGFASHLEVAVRATKSLNIKTWNTTPESSKIPHTRKIPKPQTTSCAQLLRPPGDITESSRKPMPYPKTRKACVFKYSPCIILSTGTPIVPRIRIRPYVSPWQGPLGCLC